MSFSIFINVRSRPRVHVLFDWLWEKCDSLTRRLMEEAGIFQLYGPKAQAQLRESKWFLTYGDKDI